MFSSHLPPVLLELPNELRQLLRHLRAEVLRHHLVLTGLVAKLVKEGAVRLGVGEPEKGKDTGGLIMFLTQKPKKTKLFSPNTKSQTCGKKNYFSSKSFVVA